LKSGGNKASTNPDDYELVFEKRSSADERWRLDVNERYQRAASTVVTLATLVLGGPFLFFKTLPTGKSPQRFRTYRLGRGLSRKFDSFCRYLLLFFREVGEVGAGRQSRFLLDPAP